MATTDDFKLSPELELERIVTLQQAEKISTISVDGQKRHHRDKIIQLSPKRLGMRLKDALMLRKP